MKATVNLEILDQYSDDQIRGLINYYKGFSSHYLNGYRGDSEEALARVDCLEDYLKERTIQRRINMERAVFQFEVERTDLNDHREERRMRGV